ncbi:hypothetical protein [Anaerosinus massiliensis]|uniref:hypothetical protein n=1 Tax=Massilibacillus massiliensis TaxID=1806837 RepID=UPI000DA62AAB|nr:hypothetical protein [Massilibacillus massiliensis]
MKRYELCLEVEELKNEYIVTFPWDEKRIFTKRQFEKNFKIARPADPWNELSKNIKNFIDDYLNDDMSWVNDLRITRGILLHVGVYIPRGINSFGKFDRFMKINEKFARGKRLVAF